MMLLHCNLEFVAAGHLEGELIQDIGVVNHSRDDLMLGVSLLDLGDQLGIEGCA